MTVCRPRPTRRGRRCPLSRSDQPEPARSLYAYAPVLRVGDRASDWVVNRTGLAGIDVVALRPVTLSAVVAQRRRSSTRRPPSPVTTAVCRDGSATVWRSLDGAQAVAGVIATPRPAHLDDHPVDGVARTGRQRQAEHLAICRSSSSSAPRTAAAAARCASATSCSHHDRRRGAYPARGSRRARGSPRRPPTGAAAPCGRAVRISSARRRRGRWAAASAPSPWASRSWRPGWRAASASDHVPPYPGGMNAEPYAAPVRTGLTTRKPRCRRRRADKRGESPLGTGHGDRTRKCGLQRRAGDPGRGGAGDPGVRALPGQPGDRLHPGRHAGRPARARRADRSQPWLYYVTISDPAFDRAVRRVRHHPAAVLDRAGAVVQAAVGDAATGVRDRRRRAVRVGAADRRSRSTSSARAGRGRRGSAWRWRCRRPRWCCRWSARRARSGAVPSRCCCSRIWRWCRSSSRSARWRRPRATAAGRGSPEWRCAAG